jgi:hypothetical protein
MKLLGICLAVALAVIGEAFGVESPGTNGPDYVFTVNGKPVTPHVISLHGHPKNPQPGDVICLYPFWLTLGEERTCRFVSTSREDGRLLLESADGKKRVVAVAATWTYADDKRVVVNPLAKLSNAEIQGLWGVSLDCWPEGVSEKLKEVDPAKTCLALSDSVVEDRDSGKLPALPSGLQYLVISERSNMGIKDYESLRGLSSLRFLVIQAMTAKAIDADLIAQNRSLCCLDLKTRRLDKPEALGTLSAMIDLNLAGIRGLNTVAFATKMDQLRQLNVAYTSVKDLSPLAGLTKLEEVSASMSPIGTLPQSAMPSLRTLDLLSTGVSEAAVAAFEKLNPKCVVQSRWDRSLQQAVAGATRLRVRSGGTCHRMVSEEKTQWELKDATKVQEFAKLIQIDERQSGRECMCCGDPTFEFYQGDKLLAMVGFHHGISLRWAGGCWPGDGMLTAESRDRLPQWFADNGYDAFKKGREADVAEKETARKKRQTFLECYPERARKLFNVRLSPMDKQEEEQSKRIAKAVGDPVELAISTCRALGTTGGSWSMTDNDQRLAITAGSTVVGEDFLTALKRIRNDRIAELGAARMFFWGRYGGEIPAGDRVEWTVHLAKIVLEHGDSQNWSILMRRLCELQDAKITDLLRQIAQGKVGKEVKSDEDGEPGIRASAYVALAMRGAADAKPEIEKLLANTKDRSNRAALEVSLAFLGDPNFIKADHFKIPSYTIGLAAIQAIEKFEGREGMDVLVDAGFEHPWAAVNEEAILAFQRLTGQVWCKDPQHERASRYSKDAKQWWQENGAEFIKKRRETK